MQLKFMELKKYLQTEKKLDLLSAKKFHTFFVSI